MHGLVDLSRFDYQRRLHTFAHADQMVMHGTYSQQTRDGNMLLIHFAIGKYDVVVTFIYRLLCSLAERPKCTFQISSEEHRQLDGVESLVTNVAKDVQLHVVQYRMRQSHHLAVRLVRIQDTGAYTPDIFGERHHKFLTNGVDGRIGHLCKLLSEIVEEDLRSVAQHCERRVIAHRANRFLSHRSHGNNGRSDGFFAIAEHQLLLHQISHSVFYMPAALQFLQLDTVGRKPLPVGMFRSQLLLDLSIIENLTFLRINQQNLAWLQTALLSNLCRIEVHHAHLRGYHHRTICRDGITCRPQTIAVEHATGKTSIREQQRSRAIPWFHQDGMIFEERL